MTITSLSPPYYLPTTSLLSPYYLPITSLLPPYYLPITSLLSPYYLPIISLSTFLRNKRKRFPLYYINKVYEHEALS